MNPEDRPTRAYWIALTLVLVVGVFLRLPHDVVANTPGLNWLSAAHPGAGFKDVGFDEGFYRAYVTRLSEVGLINYPTVIEEYIAFQKTLPGSVLPPMRFHFIFAGYCWHSLFGTDILNSLHYVASLCNILAFLLAALFSWRMRGPLFAFGVAALVMVAPTQLHMSQHALVDGFFAFWALLTVWLLWENLRAPGDWRWLAPYMVAFGLLVTTKENSFFVFVGVVTVLIANRWLQFGRVTKELVLATCVGPLLGAAVLVIMAGGVEMALATYRLSVSKNYTLTYAILTGDGPWYRYLVDLLLVSPVVLLLAFGALFRVRFAQKPELFFLTFIGGTYLIMCHVKYGMNLRYANMWDVPQRFLAFSCLTSMTASIPRWGRWILVAAVALICALELRNYFVLFVDYPLHELVSEGLLRALKILKSR